MWPLIFGGFIIPFGNHIVVYAYIICNYRASIFLLKMVLYLHCLWVRVSQCIQERVLCSVWYSSDLSGFINMNAVFSSYRFPCLMSNVVIVTILFSLHCFICFVFTIAFLNVILFDLNNNSRISLHNYLYTSYTITQIN